jgi:polyribonucleotide nucleotidyltransferase
MVALGYTTVSTAVGATVDAEVEDEVRNMIELELENSQSVGDSLAREEEITFVKDGITVVFRRDIRGRLQVCVSGENISKARLREMGEELANKVIQRYVYNRVVSELDQTDMKIIEQDIDDDETIRIKFRSWD